MIGVGVSHHYSGKSLDTMTAEKGNHGSPPSIPPSGSGTAVYHHPMATGRPDGYAISLPYIQKM